VHQPVNGHFLQLHEQTELERAGDRGFETFADARLQIEALEVTHDIAGSIVRTPLAFRTLGAERLQFRRAVAVSGG